MQRTFILCAVFSMVLSACGKGPSVEVRIFPKSYEVGSVKSELATPAVSEVVRMKAGHVLILACTTTPPAKVMQFKEELLARAQPEVQLSFLKEGCAL
jgi:hypothetical protein